MIVALPTACLPRKGQTVLHQPSYEGYAISVKYAKTGFVKDELNLVLCLHFVSYDAVNVDNN